MNLLKNVASLGPVLIILAYSGTPFKGSGTSGAVAFYGGLVLTLAMILLSFGRSRPASGGAHPVWHQHGGDGAEWWRVSWRWSTFWPRNIRSVGISPAPSSTVCPTRRRKLVTGLKAEVEIIHFDKETHPFLDDLMKEYVALNPRP